jgi:hypothetical protein
VCAWCVNGPPTEIDVYFAMGEMQTEDYQEAADATRMLYWSTMCAKAQNSPRERLFRVYEFSWPDHDK